MNDKLISELKNILKKDRLKHLERFAADGSAAAQFMLGEMYLLSISATEHYLDDLFEICAMDIAIKKSRGKRTSISRIYNRMTICFCTGKPDSHKALGWYKKADAQGFGPASRRIEEIRRDEVPHYREGQKIMQLFCIDYSPGVSTNLTYKIEKVD